MDRRLLTRVKLRNYKSIAACDVAPAQLSFLVGPTDRARATSSARSASSPTRCGSRSITRCATGAGSRGCAGGPGGHPTHFGIRVEFNLEASQGHYSFRVGAKAGGGYEVQREECHVFKEDRCFNEVATNSTPTTTWNVGRVVKSNLSPRRLPQQIVCTWSTWSGVEAFRPVYDALSGTGFYNLNPGGDQGRPADRTQVSSSNGTAATRPASCPLSALDLPTSRSGLRTTWARSCRESPAWIGRTVGPRETLEFRQEVRGAQHPWRFFASNMSDGTLRAFGVLLALFQGAGNSESHRRLVGIEEPEARFIPRPQASSSTVSGTRPSMHRSW